MNASSSPPTGDTTPSRSSSSTAKAESSRMILSSPAEARRRPLRPGEMETGLLLRSRRRRTPERHRRHQTDCGSKTAISAVVPSGALPKDSRNQARTISNTVRSGNTSIEKLNPGSSLPLFSGNPAGKLPSNGENGAKNKENPGNPSAAQSPCRYTDTGREDARRGSCAENSGSS